jgi:Methyltransferase FkbM domain
MSARNCARRVVFVYFSKRVPTSVSWERLFISSRSLGKFTSATVREMMISVSAVEPRSHPDLRAGVESDHPSPVSSMKVDIQGSDLSALRGATESRRHLMPIIFEYEEQLKAQFETFSEYDSFIRSVGYRIDKVIDGTYYLIVPAC